VAGLRFCAARIVHQRGASAMAETLTGCSPSAAESTSTLRTPFESETVVFWQADTPAAMWNRVADDLADARHVRLLTAARRLALMDIPLADATIAIWNAKN
jgi:hypothetical protein